MTHADAVRAAERAVVEAATRFVEDAPDVNTLDVTNAVDALRALRAATCPKCGGTGIVKQSIDKGPLAGWYRMQRCGCDNGRRRT